MNRSLYPEDWEARARRLKQQNNWHCQACDRPCLLPSETFLDFLIRCQFTVGEAIAAILDERGNTDPDKEVRFVLTTAHPNHDPENVDAELRAWCAPCHCRYDLAQLGRKRMLKREREGQLSLEMVVAPEPAGQGSDPTRIQLPIRRRLGE